LIYFYYPYNNNINNYLYIYLYCYIFFVILTIIDIIKNIKYKLPIIPLIKLPGIFSSNGVANSAIKNAAPNKNDTNLISFIIPIIKFFLSANNGPNNNIINNDIAAIIPNIKSNINVLPVITDKNINIFVINSVLNIPIVLKNAFPPSENIKIKGTISNNILPNNIINDDGHCLSVSFVKILDNNSFNLIFVFANPDIIQLR